MAGLSRMDWSDAREVVPGLVTVLLIPLSFRISDGIALGCILYTLIMVCSGQPRRVHPILGVLSVLFVLKFAFASE